MARGSTSPIPPNPPEAVAPSARSSRPTRVHRVRGVPPTVQTPPPNPIPSVTDFTTGTNSFGETILQWTLVDPAKIVETFIVLATFDGVTAPLGHVATRITVNNYEFVDRVLGAYVGAKAYTLVMIRHDGQSLTATNQAFAQKNTNISTGYLE